MVDNSVLNEFEVEIQMAMETPEFRPDRMRRLRVQLLDQAERTVAPDPSRRSKPTLRWALAALAVAVLVILFAGPKDVYATFQHMLWNLPGLGWIQPQQTARVLAEPVIEARGTLRVTVSQAYLDAKRSLVAYSVEGISSLPDSPDGQAGVCTEKPALVLPDGRSLPAVGDQGGGSEGKLEARVEFTAVPVDVNQLDFVLACLPSTPDPEGQTPWVLTLRFVPAAGSDLDAFPVIEAATPQPSATPVPTESSPASITPTAGDAASQPDTSSVSLSLDHAVPFENGFVLYAGLSWDPQLFQFLLPTKARLLDADGREIPFEFVHPELTEFSNLPQSPLALQTSAPWPSGPLTLVIDQLRATVAVNADISFDMGGSPFDGPWDIEQTIEVAGHSLTIQSVDAVTVDGHPGFQVMMETDEAIEMPMLTDQENEIIGAFGGPAGSHLTAGVLYDAGWPSFDQVTLILESAAVRMDGHWETFAEFAEQR